MLHLFIKESANIFRAEGNICKNHNKQNKNTYIPLF